MVLIYINDLTDGLQCNPKLLAGDTSLFVHNINKATNDLNNDFTKITKWAFQWKMSFNRKLQNVLPRSALLAIYKPFIRPHLDYGDTIYDKAFNEPFHAKLESLQYNATLAITGAIRGSSTEKIYEELGLESLKSRRWYRKMSFLYKVLKSESPSYLFNIIPDSNRQHQTRNSGNISSFFVKHDYFQNSFFPSAITQRNKLDCYISNADSFEVFKKRALSFIRPMLNRSYDIHNPLGVKYLTRLRIGFTHLKEHKFKHNFQDSIDTMCSCSSGIETAIHFFSIA